MWPGIFTVCVYGASDTAAGIIIAYMMLIYREWTMIIIINAYTVKTCDRVNAIHVSAD